MKQVEGNIIDIYHRRIFPGVISISAEGKILQIEENAKQYDTYLSPGLVDAHVHIESSMLTPFHFSQLVIPRGTVAIVNDPHEIANVTGIAGIQFMIEDSKRSSLKCFFGIPSCVPATPFDCSGCSISAAEAETLAKSGNFVLLSEMMNVPGVLQKDPEVMRKLQIARRYHLQADGHAPLLKGEELQKYIDAGISTDHECSNLEEALEKIKRGMKIIIREGSAARNYEALKSLIRICPDKLLFCTDDAHPDDILERGHIDKIIRKALKEGYDVFDVLKIASFNPVVHYHLPVGVLREGDPADFIRIGNLETFEVLETYIDGKKVYDKRSKEELIQEQTYHSSSILNNFEHRFLVEEEVKKRFSSLNKAIEIIPGEIITKLFTFKMVSGHNFQSDIEKDILKIVYVNRYSDQKPQVAFIKGFGLKCGAFASSVAHDSHNILAVGCTDEEIVRAINAIIRTRGGLSVVNKEEENVLALPIGGIMSGKPGKEVASVYKYLNNLLKEKGCRPEAPFMTLAFMSLIVIPEIKIGENGLFDYNSFRFIGNEN